MKKLTGQFPERIKIKRHVCITSTRNTTGTRSGNLTSKTFCVLNSSSKLCEEEHCTWKRDSSSSRMCHSGRYWARSKNNHGPKRCTKSMFTELCPAQLQWPQYPIFPTSPEESHSPGTIRTNYNRQDNCKKITTLLQHKEKILLALASFFKVEGSRPWTPALLISDIVWKKRKGAKPPKEEMCRARLLHPQDI